MERVVRLFEGKRVRFIVAEDGECLFAIYDIAAVLNLEDQRNKVMNLVFSNEYKYHRKQLVDWYGQQEYVTSMWFVIGLTLQAEQTRAHKLLNWVYNQVKNMTYLHASGKDYGLSKTGNKNYYATTQIAKVYGMTAMQLNDFLHKKCVQYKVNGTWVLYSNYAGKGYEVFREAEKANEEKVLHLYWTEKGMVMIQDLLDKAGITPKQQLQLEI